jgi:hypothetical protein
MATKRHLGTKEFVFLTWDCAATSNHNFIHKLPYIHVAVSL